MFKSLGSCCLNAKLACLEVVWFSSLCKLWSWGCKLAMLSIVKSSQRTGQHCLFWEYEGLAGSQHDSCWIIGNYLVHWSTCLVMISAIWRGCLGMGRQAEPDQCSLWCVDRRSATLGVPRRYLHWQRRHQTSSAYWDFTLPGVSSGRRDVQFDIFLLVHETRQDNFVACCSCSG